MCSEVSLPAQRARPQGCSTSKRRQMDDGHRKEGTCTDLFSLRRMSRDIDVNKGTLRGQPCQDRRPDRHVLSLCRWCRQGIGRGCENGHRGCGRCAGGPCRIISADHQNKPDIATGLARQWRYDRDGVDMITDLPGSPVGFAVQTMPLQYKKRPCSSLRPAPT